jgi:hypothetical protein
MMIVYSILVLSGFVAVIYGLVKLFWVPFAAQFEDRSLLDNIKLVRTVVAIVLTFVLAITYGTNFDGFFGVLNFTWIKFLGGAMLMFVIAPVLVLALTIMVPGVERLRLLRRSIAGDRQAGVFTAIAAFIVGYAYLLFFLWFFGQRLEELTRSTPVIVQIIPSLVFVVVAYATPFFIAAVSALALENNFSSDVTHPFLPAALGLVYMTAVTFFGNYSSAWIGDLIHVSGRPDTGASVSSTFAQTGGFSDVLQWGAFGWAILIAIAEIVLTRRENKLTWRGVRAEMPIG